MAEPPASRIPDRSTGDAKSPLVLATLTVASTLGMLASTIYVPSIPAIARALDTSVGRVQLTFVGYLLAFAAGMLVLGPLSDRYGRRRTIIFGLGLSTLAGIACAMSPTIEFLIAARVIQGIGACAGMVVGPATIRDLYGREGAAQVFAGLSIAMTLIQSFAPIPGGFLQEWFGWRANFAAVVLFASLALALADPLCAGNPRPLRPGARDRRNAAGLSHADRRAPFFGLCVRSRRRPRRVSHLFRRRPGGADPRNWGSARRLRLLRLAAADRLSRRQPGFDRLTRRLGVDSLIEIGSVILVPAGAAMVVLVLLRLGSPYAIVGPMILICLGSGLITPNAAAASLGVDPKVVGAAAGLTSFIQMAGAAGATAAAVASAPAAARWCSPSSSPGAGLVASDGLCIADAVGRASRRRPRRGLRSNALEAGSTSGGRAGAARLERASARSPLASRKLPRSMGGAPGDARDRGAARSGRGRQRCRTACLRLALSELRWRLEYAGDIEAARRRARAAPRPRRRPAPAIPPTPDADGSWGQGTDVWFLKLDASADLMLATATTTGPAAALSGPGQRPGPSRRLSSRASRLPAE